MNSTGDETVAILHDCFPFIGGAEKVAIELARVLNAPIYTAYVDSDISIPDDINVVKCNQEKYIDNLTGFLFKDTPVIRSFSLAMDLSSPCDELQSYDTIVETNNFSKHYVPAEEQTIIHYTHTPPRRLYDLYHDTLDYAPYDSIETLIASYFKILKIIDKEGVDYIDKFVANSDVVQNRIESYYRTDSEVVFPPVTGEWRNEGDDGYFVTWSRLISEKRTAMIVETFTELDAELRVAGDGPQRERIENIAAGHDNIQVLGYVRDIESLVANATAVVYAPVEEDFGLVGAETLSAGKPLLGVNEGYTKHQVSDETGALFEPNIDSLRQVVEEFDPEDYDASDIQASAEKYQQAHFGRRIKTLVESAGDSDQ